MNFKEEVEREVVKLSYYIRYGKYEELEKIRARIVELIDNNIKDEKEKFEYKKWKGFKNAISTICRSVKEEEDFSVIMLALEKYRKEKPELISKYVKKCQEEVERGYKWKELGIDNLGFSVGVNLALLGVLEPMIRVKKIRKES